MLLLLCTETAVTIQRSGACIISLRAPRSSPQAYDLWSIIIFYVTRILKNLYNLFRNYSDQLFKIKITLFKSLSI